MKNMQYLSSLPELKNIVSDKHILLDTDVIISVLAYDSDQIFDDLLAYNVTLCIIHPVLIELMNTSNKKDRRNRIILLDKLSLPRLSISKRILSISQDIQLYLQEINIYPSPTDMYLGSTLATFST